jgi:leucyl-tRNA synthetase
MEWTEAGVAGAYKFTQRVFRLVEAFAGGVEWDAVPESFGPAALRLRRATHRTIAAVTESFEAFAFNVAVARLYEFASAIGDAEKADHLAGDDPGLRWARLEAFRNLALLVAPMMPHLAEEIRARLFPDEGRLVAEESWPVADPDLLKVETVTIAVQVMGKLRGTLVVPPDSNEADVFAAAEADANVERALAGRTILKRVFVPNRIVNFVVAN